MRLLNRIITTPVVATIAIGVATFSTGIASPFGSGDDQAQIVNNIPAHSILNIGLFFQGGTFYSGQGLAPLSGSFYRPLMTTVFSLLYTVFGANPVPFHITQLALCISSTVLLYLLFRRCSFHPVLALILSLVFLVHPIDSEAVFAIPNMQDALFFFFGILALWLLLRLDSIASLLLVATSLFLSLLSKETGVIFVVLAVIYLFWWNRRRLAPFLSFMAVLLVTWFLLRLHALGSFADFGNGPIGTLPLTGRLLMIPSIVALYLLKLVYPWQLATSYNWVDSTFSVSTFVLPLLTDLAVLAAVVVAGIAIRKRGSIALERTYWFFAAWSALGLVAHMQIFPLEQTANEVWFRIGMPGLLGMIGVGVTALRTTIHFDRRVLIGIGSLAITLLSVTTAIRGTVWANPSELTAQDIANSPNNYLVDETGAYQNLQSGNLDKALSLALKSVSLYPTNLNYGTLGQVYAKLGDYPAAYRTYQAGLRLGDYYGLDEDLAELTTVYGDPVANRQFLQGASNKYPTDAAIWLSLAYSDYRNNDPTGARYAIAKAYKYAPRAPGVDTLYYIIMNGLPLTVTLTP